MKRTLTLLTALLLAPLTALPAAGPPLALPQSANQVRADAAQKENTCTGKGRNAKCFIGGYYWSTDNGDGDWAITNPKPGDLRFELRQGDIAQWDKQRSHAAERNEISNSNHKFPLEEDIWFSFGLMVEPGPKVSSRWLVIGQLKASNDPGDQSASPPVGQELNAGDQFRITVRTASEKPLKHNPGSKAIYVDPAFERGRIYRLVYRIKYSQKAGHLQVWRDGKEIANYKGPVGYVSNTGPYWKFGIYRDPAPETIAVHYYDIKFGGPELEPR
ncbi:MAG: heparin lyase I family protein [Verrucomicrobiota bacterium]